MPCSTTWLRSMSRWDTLRVSSQAVLVSEEEHIERPYLGLEGIGLHRGISVSYLLRLFEGVRLEHNHGDVVPVIPAHGSGQHCASRLELFIPILTVGIQGLVCL